MPINIQKNIIYKGIGKRKTSVAKVFLKFSKIPSIVINTKNFETYFSSIKIEALTLLQPYLLVNLSLNYHISIYVNGGGIYSQLFAIQLGLAKAISNINKCFLVILKTKKFLTSDSRIKESKKYGLKKARKAPQYTKR